MASAGSQDGNGTTHHGCTDVFVPPEWFPHEATWLQWPKGSEKSLEPVFCQIVQALQNHEKVNLIVSNDLVRQSAQRALSISSVSTEAISLHSIPTDWCWCRDNGPLFASDAQGSFIIDWAFNAWGSPRSRHQHDDQVPSLVAQQLGMRSVRYDMVNEGGCMEFNGAGALITSEPCLHNRNPTMSKPEMEKTLRQTLGVEIIIWLQRFPSDDNITRGHPDGIARFIDPITVIVAESTNSGDPDSSVYASAAEILAAAGFHVRRMKIRRTRSGLAANYLNWYVANGVVLVGIFGEADLDQWALEEVERYFPSRKVVGIDVSRLWMRGGGVHCVTQQQPKGGNI